ncbi:2,3-bisphosphoglycerate-independent phosphoglycerate mutase [Longimicrobium sp.]|uniref:2,3-bisphosphoglycerate-independent phosphoglycerate mutase n=1 Tax=Longimicrobium sp. TaxID=2029185 RepID=UPI002B6C1A62|nr:2,3-bisphosphoglycerate-independent phosphoglycerate mutase [Longimicrobium sp.]HSU15157.1 2,3-bisphosphoglycerate-independent phosphoglycerate mutase [Longimicrobium sp.]
MTDLAAGERPRVCFVILDGWGLREPAWDNAVAQANAPTWRHLWEEGDYPRARLTTHGPAVGLPAGQMGNSEVGHLNLGAGRVVMQSLQRISRAIETGEFRRNDAFLRLIRSVKERGATLHLMGLVGPGGVHAVDEHLLALCELAQQEAAPAIRIHLFLDGRDTPPSSAREFLTELSGRAGIGEKCRIATLMGRYWAMDRDHRWDRTQQAYRAMVYGEGIAITDPVQAVAAAYQAGETDEFVKPRVVVDADGRPIGPVRSGDGVIFFNFRADRARQMTRALADRAFDGFDRGAERPEVEVVTMTQYDEAFPLSAAFPPQPMDDILAEVLAAHGLKSFRTAETEKYPHVTFFFNGGVEEAPEGESRRLVSSPKVATYDLQPEMSAADVTAGLVEAIRSMEYDVLVCNYANPDMVGHTGSLEAAKKAVEAVDAGLAQVVAACRETGTTLIVSADHGNCEQMWDPETNGPHTAHTLNPVGIILLEPEDRRTATGLADGALCDVAPTMLGLIGVPQPEAMTGRDLRVLAPATSAESRRRAAAVGG